MQLNIKFLLICFLLSVVDLKVLFKPPPSKPKSKLQKAVNTIKTVSVVSTNNYPSIIAFGDTGQVDTWFYENIGRKIVEKKDKTIKDKKIKLVENSTNVKFDNFEELITFAKTKLQRNFYDEVVILGDSIYTDHKKGLISYKAKGSDPYFKEKAAKPTQKAKNLNKEINGFDYFGKDLIDDIDGTPVSSMFKNRLTNASEVLTKMFSKMDFLKAGAKVSILPGNHSTDIDDLVERTHTKEKLKASKMTPYFPKHSKVKKEGNICYLDINAGDVQLYTAYYNETLTNAEETEELQAVFDKIKTKDEQYEYAITKGVFNDMSYGRNKVDTLIGALKIYEAILTLKLCAKPENWRVIRTHVAPFNAEVDYGAYFGIKKRVVCRNIFYPEKDYLDFSKFSLAQDAKLDNAKLNKEKAKGRMYDCKYVTDKNITPISIMEGIDSAQPHFWLGSHLHASQIIAAPYIGSGKRGTEFMASQKLDIPDTVKQGPICINRFDEVKKETFEIEATKEKYRESMNKNVKQCSGVLKETISINELNPGFHLIFVIGNSGRFLDPFFSAECSLSEILWQRASIPGNKFVENEVEDLVKVFDNTKIDNLKTSFIQPIKDINEKTNYGFATVKYSETTAVIDLHENVNDIVATVTVTKVKGATQDFKKLINEKDKEPFTFKKYTYCKKK